VHIDLLASDQGTTLSNFTYSTDYIPLLVLQLFFDQTLLDDINEVEPYSSNTTPRTPNEVDYLYQVMTNNQVFDPHLNYALRGTNISEGIVAWLRIGIDLQQRAQDVYATGTLGIPNNAGPRPRRSTFDPLPAFSAQPAPPLLVEEPGVVPETSGDAPLRSDPWRWSWRAAHGHRGHAVVTALVAALVPLLAV
jgi:hypothetical protein